MQADDKDNNEMFECFMTDFQLPFLYPLFTTVISIHSILFSVLGLVYMYITMATPSVI